MIFLYVSIGSHVVDRAPSWKHHAMLLLELGNILADRERGDRNAAEDKGNQLQLGQAELCRDPETHQEAA